jgi:isopenicillin N synthase-like dioxygenase
MTRISEPLSNPPCIEAHRTDIKAYMEQAHSIASVICSHLDKQLRLAPGTLISLQPMDRPSGTNLRMLHYPPQPIDDQRTSFVGHTDIGTLTILFNITGGLQLLAPGADPQDESSWVYVQPVPGCAVVNLGDAMVEWSAGILRSNMHRVTFAPGEQSTVSRYSLAYLVRPGTFILPLIP